MSEENNKSNDDLSREEINKELDKLKEDENWSDNKSKWLCYSIPCPIESKYVLKILEKCVKGIRENDDDDNCPSSSSNDNQDDNSNTPKEE